ncbi:hypothetical protein P8X24_11015 [Pyrococcus kukulkanii]|uniref:hypothetical protein n=1 Tax=Pyrococcus kukulkanii TaxID=1609559 RepID=UPI00356979FF
MVGKVIASKNSRELVPPISSFLKINDMLTLLGLRGGRKMEIGHKVWENITPEEPNIVVEYEYPTYEDIEDGPKEVRIKVLREGMIGFGLSEEDVIISYVPITCNECHRTYLLPTHMEKVATYEREMGPEYQWLVTYEGECPVCKRNNIEVEIEAFEYPPGNIGAINVIRLEGARFPNKLEIDSKINELLIKELIKGELGL